MNERIEMKIFYQQKKKRPFCVTWILMSRQFMMRKKNIIFELFLWIQNNQIWMKEMKNHVKIFYQQKKHGEKELRRDICVVCEKTVWIENQVQSSCQDRSWGEKKTFLSFSLENCLNKNSNWISIFEQTISIKKMKPLKK